MNIHRTYFLRRNGSLPQFCFAGIEMPWASLIRETDTHIALKIPSHSGWRGIGMTRGYCPPAIVICQKLADNRVRPIIGWENNAEKSKSCYAP